MIDPPAKEPASPPSEKVKDIANNTVETILSLEVLETLVKDSDFEILTTEYEIQGRAKGDFLSKAIAIFQTSWFSAQCVARWIQGLDLTELEVATVAFASLNGVLYYFWWNKPLGAVIPVKLQLKRKLADYDYEVCLNYFQHDYTSSNILHCSTSLTPEKSCWLQEVSVDSSGTKWCLLFTNALYICAFSSLSSSSFFSSLHP